MFKQHGLAKEESGKHVVAMGHQLLFCLVCYNTSCNVEIDREDLGVEREDVKYRLLIYI